MHIFKRISLAALLSTTTLFASNWTAGGGGDWSDGGNWSAGVPTDSIDALFPEFGGGSVPVSVDVVAIAQTVTFAANDTVFNITPSAPGNTLTIDNNTITFTQGFGTDTHAPHTLDTDLQNTSLLIDGTGSTTARNKIALGGDNSALTSGITLDRAELYVSDSNQLGPATAPLTFINSGSSDLFVTGTFSSNHPIILNSVTRGRIVVEAGQVLTQNGVISDIGLSADLIQDGPGTLILTATNTFTGDLEATDGNISVSSVNNFLNAPRVFILSPGYLTVTESMTTGKDFRLNDGNIRVADGRTLTLTGIVTTSSEGGTNLHKWGPGLLDLQGSNFIPAMIHQVQLLSMKEPLLSIAFWV